MKIKRSTSLTRPGNWETGESEPSIRELVLIAKQFGVSADDILFRDLRLNKLGGVVPMANEALWEAIKGLRKEVDEQKKQR